MHETQFECHLRVHVKGHKEDEGNDHAAELVQWGKIAGPFSYNFSADDSGEGDPSWEIWTYGTLVAMGEIGRRNER